jgi:serine/threonine protein kinase
MRDEPSRTRVGLAVDAGFVDDDPLLGRVLLDRFEIVAPIARGGMGRVYRAVQRPLGRPIALKVLDVRGVVATRSDFQRRFFLEAATAAKLHHPNTIVIFDYGVADDDLYFIAMELVSGSTLAQVLRAEGPMEPRRAIHVVRQICGSLGEAHGLGVVHRDLKPSNVLLTRRGSDDDFVKVLDFGLVKVLGDDEPGTELTQSGVMMGTPRYMSPEQITGRDVTAASDVYALGAVLFHVLAGRPPFDGESKFDIFAAHVGREPPALREVFPDHAVPPRLEALVRRCLAKDPRERFASLVEVERELVQCERALRTEAPSDLTGSAVATTPHRRGQGPVESELAYAPTRVAPAPVAPLPTAPTSSSGIPSPIASPPAAQPASDASGSASRPYELPAPGMASGSHTGLVAPPGGLPFEHSSTGYSSQASVFQPPPQPPRSAAQSGLAGFFGVIVALGLVGLGAVAYRYMTRTEEPPAVVDVAPLPPLAPPSTGAPTPVAPLPGPAVSAAAPVRVRCNVEGARLLRGETDLGDCGALLPVPAGESWELEVRAPGHVSRRVVIFAGQGEVQVTLARRSTGGSRAPAPAEPAPAAPPRRGGDVRNPWD